MKIGYLFFKSELVIPFGIFCLLITLVLFAFFVYQFYHAAINVTTNETYKFDDINDDITRLNRAYKQNNPLVTNPYNKGFFNNLLQVFFPKQFVHQASIKSPCKGFKDSLSEFKSLPASDYRKILAEYKETQRIKKEQQRQNTKKTR